MQVIDKNINTNIVSKHKIILDDRQILNMTGVTKVQSINTECVSICIVGKNLHIEKLDVDAGNVEIVGEIQSIKYLGQKQGLLKRIFK